MKIALTSLLSLISLSAAALSADLSTLLPSNKELTDGGELESLTPATNPKKLIRTNPQTFRTAEELEPILEFLRTPELRARDLEEVVWAYYRLLNDAHVVLFRFKDPDALKSAEAALLKRIGEHKPCKTFAKGKILALVFGSDIDERPQLAELVRKRVDALDSGK